MQTIQQLIDSGLIQPSISILPLLAAAAPALIGGAASIIGSSQKNKQQNKQQALQIQHDKDMAEIGHQNQIDLAQKTYDLTNAKAQKKTLEEAGLNPALMYGGGGGGGTSVSTGTGAAASNIQQETTEPFSGMGIQLQQAALMAAQRKNIEADTAKKEVETAKTAGVDTSNAAEELKLKQFNNQVNELTGADYKANNYKWATDKLEASSKKEMAEYDAWQAAGFDGKETTDKNSPIAKAIAAGIEETLVRVRNAKKDGDIKEAEKAIKQFEANLAKEGIAPNTPWGVKLGVDIARKLGILDWIGGK